MRSPIFAFQNVDILAGNRPGHCLGTNSTSWGREKSPKVVLGNTGREDTFWGRPWYSCQWRLKISRSVQHGREISSLGRTAFPMMAVKFQTARSTLNHPISNPTTTSTHSVRTHFVGDEARSWPLIYPDCSRFWECGPNYETCLFECASCACLQFPEQENDPQCDFQCKGKDGWQWALTFDEKWVLNTFEE